MFLVLLVLLLLFGLGLWQWLLCGEETGTLIAFRKQAKGLNECFFLGFESVGEDGKGLLEVIIAGFLSLHGGVEGSMGGGGVMG